MLILQVVLAAVAVLFVGIETQRAISFRAAYKGLPARTARDVAKNLSWPAEEIVRLHCKLPMDRRVDGLVSTLKALDVKYGGKDAVNAAFTHMLRRFDNTITRTKSWNMARTHREYHSFRAEITEVLAALAEQESAKQIYAHQHGIDQASELLAQLRQERADIAEVTKALSA